MSFTSETLQNHGLVAKWSSEDWHTKYMVTQPIFGFWVPYSWISFSIMVVGWHFLSSRAPATLMTAEISNKLKVVKKT